MDQEVNPNSSLPPRSPPKSPASLGPPSPSFAPTNGAASPFLDVLGDQGVSRAAATTDEWTHSIPYGASPPGRPPGGIDAAFGSPPIPGTSPLQHPREDIRGGFGASSPPISPRVGPGFLARSPPAEYQGIGAFVGGTSPRGRPVSMPNQYSHGTAGPYHTQPPYLGIRDPQAPLSSRSSSRKSNEYDFHAFDTLPTYQEDPALAGVPALLTSAHQTLYVHEVGPESLKYLGHIEGLRGMVLSAKIIPNVLQKDKLRLLRPLVVMVVHGPYIPNHGTEQAQGLDQSQHSEFDPSESVMQAMQTAAHGPVSETQFQTTVEVYSLKERQHVATLYRSPVVDSEPVRGERRIEPPLPSGALSVYVKGRFIVVASAISGEVYIYATAQNNSEPAFRCVGKTWTGVPLRKGRTWSTSSASASSEGDAHADGVATTLLPVLSLGSRWLAVMPPVASSKSTLHGTVDLPRGDKIPPGLLSHAPDPQPSSTCDVDTPLEDSRINRVARDVAQEMLKGAQWVGAQGIQAWKNYWNKPSEPTPPQEILRSPRPAVQFPPTHASDDANRGGQNATVISIFDLEKLTESVSAKASVALQPIATFSLPDGCSFLSFNPTGLSLLTANTKGDVQYVWDLMRMVHPRPEAFGPSTNTVNPLVRQVARFTRVTQAHILDVVWMDPIGEKLAVLTNRGTVHLHDLPGSAFTWPPPCLKRPTSPPARTTDMPPVSSGWSATLSSVTGRAQPILAAARDTRIPNLGGLNLSGSGAGRQGSKIVASGFSKSVGAATGTMSSLRHMGESRLHVSSGEGQVAPNSVRWISHRDSQMIAVVGDRKVRLYSVVSKTDQRSKTGRRYSAVGLRLAEHALPGLKDPEARLPRDGILLGGFWPISTPRSQRGIRALRAPAPLSYAELESCAPFQPVYADQRVTLQTFDRDADLHTGTHPTPWAFGEPIPVKPIASSRTAAFRPESDAEPVFPNEADASDHLVSSVIGFSPLDDPIDDLGPIASIIRHDGAERADGAGPSAVTVAMRPTKKKKKRRVEEHGRDTAQAIIEGFGEGHKEDEGELL